MRWGRNTQADPSDHKRILGIIHRSKIAEEEYRALQLYPYGTEVDDDFALLAQQISASLLSRFQVLTAVHEYAAASKPRHECIAVPTEKSFLDIYSRFLQIHRLSRERYFQQPRDMITCTCGANGPLLSLIYPGDRGVFGCTMWGFSSVPEFTDYTQAGEWAATQPWAIRLDYSRYPDTLEIQVDPKQLSVDQCISCIREICDHEGIKLLETFVPPEGSDTNGAHA